MAKEDFHLGRHLLLHSPRAREDLHICKFGNSWRGSVIAIVTVAPDVLTPQIGTIIPTVLPVGECSRKRTAVSNLTPVLSYVFERTEMGWYHTVEKNLAESFNLTGRKVFGGYSLE